MCQPVIGGVAVAPAAGLWTLTVTPCTPTLMLDVCEQVSPCESVAFTVTRWLPLVMVTAWSTEDAVVVVKTAVPSTSISIEVTVAPVGGVADAVTCPGEVAGALFAGLVIVTKQVFPLTLYWI